MTIWYPYFWPVRGITLYLVAVQYEQAAVLPRPRRCLRHGRGKISNKKTKSRPDGERARRGRLVATNLALASLQVSSSTRDIGSKGQHARQPSLWHNWACMAARYAQYY
ncbi:hypothetical protein V8C43DRAFT_276918 [Trichoderma afarasin]